MPISGQLGPRGDGYAIEAKMTPERGRGLSFLASEAVLPERGEYPTFEA